MPAKAPPVEPFALPAGACWAGDDRKPYEFAHRMRGPFWRYYGQTTVYTGRALTAVAYCDTVAIADATIAVLSSYRDRRPSLTLNGDRHEGALLHHKTEGFSVVCGCRWLSNYSWNPETAWGEHDEHVENPDAGGDRAE